MKVEMEVTGFGAYLLLTMQRRKVSLRKVAASCGINPGSLWRICAGYRFEARWIMPLAQWMELTPKQLWDLLEEDATLLAQKEQHAD